MQTFRDGPRNPPRVRGSGWWNLGLALGYGFAESSYFGWNLIPKSGAEMACDGIALLLIIVTSNRVADSIAGES
jgi:hypothetical protein